MSRRVQLFGCKIDRVRMPQAVTRVYRLINGFTGTCRYVVTPNVDHVVMLEHHEGLRRAYDDADVVLADGMPVVLASRLLGRSLPERVTGADLTVALFEAAEYRGGMRVFLLGAGPGVAEQAAAKIHQRWPAVEVTGTYSPPMGFEKDPQQNAEILSALPRRVPTCWSSDSAPRNKNCGCTPTNRKSKRRSRCAWARRSTFWPNTKAARHCGCKSRVWNGCIAWPPNRAVCCADTRATHGSSPSLCTANGAEAPRLQHSPPNWFLLPRNALMSPETSPSLARRITNSEPRVRADEQNSIRGPFARILDVSSPAVAARPLSRTALVRALDMTPDAVIFFTPELNIVEANAAAIRGTGYRRSELQALRLDDVLADDGQGSWHAGILRVLRGESLEHGMPALLRSQDGNTSPVRFDVQLINEAAGPLLVAVVHCRRDQRDAHELLARARHFDYLTELPTRVALEYRLRRAERQARRQRTCFAVLFLDFDRFKEVNDRYGHRVGDAVLRSFSRRLNECVRPGDFIARYGGDEFVILVEDVRIEEELQRMAERIRTESGVSLEIGDATLDISVSVGLAIGHAGSSAAALVDEADRAMYASKRARR